MGEIGKMDRKIELLSQKSTKSAMGAPVKAYSHYKYCYASRESAGTGAESYVNNRLEIAPRFKYRLHTDAQVIESMKLIDNAIEYNILQVEELEKMFIEILVEKIIQ